MQSRQRQRPVTADAASAPSAPRYVQPMLALVLLACSVHTREVGLVSAEPPSVQTADGHVYTLTLDHDGDPLRYLHGCIVVVEGPRLGHRIVVKDWHVQDAGDGSGGFVGPLREYGARLVIDDRNTGTTLVIADEVAAQLRPWVGQPVLLIGHIMGGNLVMPVAWRVLAEER